MKDVETRKCFILTTVVFLLIVIGSIGYHYLVPRTYDHYTDLLELRYGDSCTWETEKVRANYSMGFLNINTNLWIKTLKTHALELDFVYKAKSLCNTFELLMCNKTTQKCVCGDLTLFSILGDDASSKIIGERVGENWRKCRWAEGTYCLPEDFLNSSTNSGKNYVDFGCSEGTSCRSKKTRKLCSLEMLKQHAIENEEEDLQREVLIGNVCTCQADNPTLGILGALT